MCSRSTRFGRDRRIRFTYVAGQVDRRLALAIRGVLLGVAVQNGALKFTRCGQRHPVLGPASSQAITLSSPRSEPVSLAAHRPIDRPMPTSPVCRRERLPAGDGALAVDGCWWPHAPGRSRGRWSLVEPQHEPDAGATATQVATWSILCSCKADSAVSRWDLRRLPDRGSAPRRTRRAAGRPPP